MACGEHPKETRHSALRRSDDRCVGREGAATRRQPLAAAYVGVVDARDSACSLTLGMPACGIAVETLAEYAPAMPLFRLLRNAAAHRAARLRALGIARAIRVIEELT